MAKVLDMPGFLFEPLATPSVAVAGETSRFPVRRIFCIGRNYADHVREMGLDADRSPPTYFMKPADAIVESGATIPFPVGSKNVHHEIELVVAIGRDGRDIPQASALDHVCGYAVGNDLTRRDLQMAARDAGGPWDMAKGFDDSAHLGPIHLARDVGHIGSGRIWLKLNGEPRQDADISTMIWSVPELISRLSQYQTLKAGDLIFTGTPAGVGQVHPGDTLEGGVDGLGLLSIRFAP